MLWLFRAVSDLPQFIVQELLELARTWGKVLGFLTFALNTLLRGERSLVGGDGHVVVLI